MSGSVLAKSMIHQMSYESTLQAVFAIFVNLTSGLKNLVTLTPATKNHTFEGFCYGNPKFGRQKF